MMNTKNLAMAGGLVILAGVAVAGRTRHTSNSAVAPMPLTQAVDYSNQAPASPAAYASYQPDDQDGYIASVHRPILVRSAEAYQAPAQYVQQPSYGQRYDSSHPVYRSEYRHGRSTGKSVAIVAGSAGAGAAIGAIAGGGKGAGIGAISGGAAGFIYDRLTHNH